MTEFNPGEFKETSNLLKITSERKGELKNLMNWFKKILAIEISKRDFSEEKGKNASILGIKIPKFRGYDSSMDFYTFKAEFEKLVSPRVQGKLVADYLKTNYLDGHALALVKEINDINQIWERLKLSFRNVANLLFNKLSEIENDVPLWKMMYPCGK